MKPTLLEIVQDILSDLDMDEVNSIVDTTHSLQVASIVKNCYMGMIGNRNWPHLRKLISLESSGDVSRPVYLKLPVGVKELVSIRYANTDGTFSELKYRTPDEFLTLSGRKSLSDTTTSIVDWTGTQFLITNNTDPRYWTSFDDEWIVTDSYDIQTETTIQASKTQCIAYINPEWTTADSFTPDLPIEAFPALFEEAKSTTSLNLKQMLDQKAEAKALRQQRWLSRKAWSAHGGVEYPNYGRKGRK